MEDLIVADLATPDTRLILSEDLSEVIQQLVAYVLNLRLLCSVADIRGLIGFALDDWHIDKPSNDPRIEQAIMAFGGQSLAHQVFICRYGFLAHPQQILELVLHWPPHLLTYVNIYLYSRVYESVVNLDDIFVRYNVRYFRHQVGDAHNLVESCLTSQTGINADLVQVYMFIVLVSDGFFEPASLPATIDTAHFQGVRFFMIARQLPMELQARLAHYVNPDMKLMARAEKHGWIPRKEYVEGALYEIFGLEPQARD